MAYSDITYQDGTKERVQNITRPAHMIRLERRFPQATTDPDKGLTYEATVYLAWLAAGQPGADFDAWIDKLEDVRTTWLEEGEEVGNGSPPAEGGAAAVAPPNRASRRRSQG